MARFLRNKRDGFIYDWNEILSENSLCEEVTEEEAFPERFIPQTQNGRKAKLDLSTGNIPEEPVVENVELNAEASRGL